jgi:hypothetical protein
MLTVYRRHLAACPHAEKGRPWRRCACPVWVAGTIAGKKIKQSMDLTSLEAATEKIREWEQAGKVLADGERPAMEGITVQRRNREVHDRRTGSQSHRGIDQEIPRPASTARDGRSEQGASPVPHSRRVRVGERHQQAGGSQHGPPAGIPRWLGGWATGGSEEAGEDESLLPACRGLRMGPKQPGEDDQGTGSEGRRPYPALER